MRTSAYAGRGRSDSYCLTHHDMPLLVIDQAVEQRGARTARRARPAQSRDPAVHPAAAAVGLQRSSPAHTPLTHYRTRWDQS